jgi:DNA-directed RNA polymerase specialized sigma24 family protein
MTDREIITEYHNTAMAAGSLLLGMAWNHRHGLPVLDMPDRVRQLQTELVTFEKILSRITDRRTRVVLRCRYALGMSDRLTAEYMGLSIATVARIASDALSRMS